MLKLPKSAINIFLFSQFFRSINHFKFLLKIVFIIHFSEFAIQVQEIIKSLNVMMIGIPGIFIIISWNRTGFSPTILQFFKSFKIGTHICPDSGNGFELFNDSQSSLKIFLKILSYTFIIIISSLFIFKIKFIEFLFSFCRIRKIDNVSAFIQKGLLSLFSFLSEFQIKLSFNIPNMLTNFSYFMIF